MKSPMIVNADWLDAEEKANYSDLTVLRSGAGYYVGTMHHNKLGFEEPGSRDSFCYFATAEEARDHIWEIEKGIAATRMNP